MLRPIAPSSWTSSRCLKSAVRPLRLVRRPILGSRGSVCALPMESSSRSFFNRETATQLLLDSIESEPTEVILMVGPRNCGKTALLVHVAAILNALQKHPRVFYLDCRKSDATSPKLLANALDMLLPRWLPSPHQSPILRGVVMALSTLGFEWGGTKVDMRKLVADGPMDEAKLVKVLNIFENVLIALGNETGRKPAIIIDEAHLLRLWDDARLLRAFTDWIVRNTKQTGHCHVILATSEFAFQDWVSNAFKENWRPVVIGNLPKDEAGEFFEAMLRQARERRSAALVREGGATPRSKGAKAPSQDKAQGLDKAVLADKGIRNMVYEVSGGNPSLLRRAATKLGTEDITSPAVREVLTDLVQYDMHLLKDRSAGGVDYTSTQFELMFDLLAASKYGAVGYATVIDALNQGGAADGKKVLLALIRANLVSSRPLSHWDCEIPRDAFDDESMPGGLHSRLVTAASALDLYHWKEIRAAEQKKGA